MKTVTRDLSTDTVAVLHKLLHVERTVQVTRLLDVEEHENDDFEISQIYDRIVEIDRAIDQLLGLA